MLATSNAKDVYIGGVGPIQSGTLRQHKNHAIGVNIPMISDPGPSISPQVSRKGRSEEHTSELQSHSDLVCRLLLEKKKNKEVREHTVEKKKTTQTEEWATK